MNEWTNYPKFRLEDGEADRGRWVDVDFARVEDDDFEDVPGKVLVSVDPSTNTISFAMEDREFNINRQLLADTINELWPEELRRMEQFVEQQQPRPER